jgi:anti-sigma-K factor RskA
MDYSRPSLVDSLASTYVQGTLHGGARRRFETLLLAHPALRNAVHEWQARLAPLSQSVAPLVPPPIVWERIESRLFGLQTSSVKTSNWQAIIHNIWHSIRLWQATTAAGLAMALGAVLMLNTASQAPTVVVLNGGNGAQQFVASVNKDGHSLTLTPVSSNAAAPSGKSLQLWALPTKGQPQSLGVLVNNAPFQLQTSRLQAGLLSASAFAVSVEPIGGSPTGLPTGEVIAIGKLF